MIENLEKLFNKEGADGVELFRESIEKRKATGATSRSIAYTVQATDTKVVLEIRAVGHPSIQRLETGFTAEQAEADPPNFQDIVIWTRAKGFGDSAVAGAIFAGILKNGWSEDVEHRTPGLNGGTAGILSDPRAVIQQNIKTAVGAAIKLDFMKFIKGSKK